MRVKAAQNHKFPGRRPGLVDFGPYASGRGQQFGKSTVCEALDLVLGPERLFRRPVIDEHDFHCGRIWTLDGNPVEISIEAVLVDLSEEAKRRLAGICGVGTTRPAPLSTRRATGSPQRTGLA